MMGAVLAAAAEAAGSPPLWSEAWWSEFLRSSGFGGVAAVLAALLAFVGILVKNGNDRRLARDVRSGEVADSRAQRWWEMYRWSLEQLGTLEPDRAVLLLDELKTSAPTDVELGLVLVAIDLYTWGENEEGDA